jgi:adenosylcobinamide-GDP ribazoletransferase
VRTFLAAVQFLTTLPVPLRNVTEREIGRSPAFFPWVGLLVGSLVCAAYLGLSHIFPTVLGRILAYVALLFVSSAFHLDGLSDAVDGLYGRKPAETALRIMKDPHVGAMGVLALIVAAVLRLASWLSLPEEVFRRALVASPAVGHAAMVLCLTLPYARQRGLGRVFEDHRSRLDWPVALATATLSSFVLLRLPGLGALVAGIGAAIVVLVRARRSLGGFTGDICGAVSELTEIAFLLALVALSRPFLEIECPWTF